MEITVKLTGDELEEVIQQYIESKLNHNIKIASMQLDSSVTRIIFSIEEKTDSVTNTLED